MCSSGSNSEGYHWMWNAWHGEVKTETVGKGFNHSKSNYFSSLVWLRLFYGGCIVALWLTLLINLENINVDVLVDYMWFKCFGLIYLRL